MLLLTLSATAALASFDVCSTYTSVTSGERLRPGQALLVGVCYGDYGGCGLGAELYPTAGGDPAILSGIDETSYGDGAAAWYRLPETLAPGDYTLVAGSDTLPVVVDATLPLGAVPALVSSGISLTESESPFGDGLERRACVTLDVPAPGVPGWAVELEVGTVRTWVVVPPEGLEQLRACVSVSLIDRADGETCIDVETLDPYHVTVEEWGPSCATWPAEPAEADSTGGTGASPSTDTGSADPTTPSTPTGGSGASGCSSSGSGGLVAALVVPLLLRRSARRGRSHRS